MKITRFLLGLAPALVFVPGCGGVVSGNIEIPREAIQTAVDEYFPISSKGKEDAKAPVDVTLSDPEILLTEGSDQIGIEMRIEVQMPKGAPAPAAPKFPSPRGGPGGHPPFSRGGSPTANKSPGDDETVVGKVAVFSGVRYDAQTNEFFLENAKIQHTDVGKLPPRLKEPVETLVEKLLNEYLARHAVYKLGDDNSQSKIAKAVLKSVSVRDGKLIVGIGI